MLHARPSPLAHAVHLLEAASCEPPPCALMVQPNAQVTNQCLSGSFAEEDIQ